MADDTAAAAAAPAPASEGGEASALKFPTVSIDEGVQKYVLIKITQEGEFKLVVAGRAAAEFHADIFEPIQDSMYKLDADAIVQGGGRIVHDTSGRKIKVYGYSVAYGRADHAKSVELLQAAYPEYEVTFSNEGY